MKDSKQYEWTERKVSAITCNIGVGIFLVCLGIMLVILILSAFTAINFLWGVGIFFASMPVSLIFLAISGITSTKGKYTTGFIDKMEKLLKECRSKEELIAVRKYFYSQAVGENKLCRLAYPSSIKTLYDKIAAQIEILEKIENHGQEKK